MQPDDWHGRGQPDADRWRLVRYRRSRRRRNGKHTGGNGIVTINSGTINSPYIFYIGRQGGKGWVNVNGGTINSTGYTVLCEARGDSPAWTDSNYGELDLNGGLFETPYCSSAGPTPSTRSTASSTSTAAR